MPAASELSHKPSRARILFASAVVAVTVLGLWKFIDCRMQPPAPPGSAVTSDKV